MGALPQAGQRRAIAGGLGWQTRTCFWEARTRTNDPARRSAGDGVTLECASGDNPHDSRPLVHSPTAFRLQVSESGGYPRPSPAAGTALALARDSEQACMIWQLAASESDSKTRIGSRLPGGSP